MWQDFTRHSGIEHDHYDVSFLRTPGAETREVLTMIASGAKQSLAAPRRIPGGVVQPDLEPMSDLIGGIYTCALEPAPWLGTLERLARHFGARSVAVCDRGSRGVSFHCAWASAQDARQEFAQYHMRHSPLLTMGWHFEVDTPITPADFMWPEELRRTMFYRDWLAPQRWFDIIGVILAKSAGRISVVMFLRPETAAPPSAPDRTLLRLLSPHLRRAHEIQGALDAATARAGNLAADLDLVPAPILLFDSSPPTSSSTRSSKRSCSARGPDRRTREEQALT